MNSSEKGINITFHQNPICERKGYSYLFNNKESHSCECVCEGVSKSFWTESITKCMLTTINTHLEATQKVMVAKLTKMTHKIVIQLHLVADSCTICSSCSRWPVQTL
jgi:hypothetical protein